MNLSHSNKTLLAAVLACALAGGTKAMAQQVIFPQQQQAGVAALVHDGANYVLQNDLLKATFVREGATLKFGGCPELNLEAGTELFEIKTGDGSTTVKASEMTLVGDVRVENYAANPAAVKGSKKLAGKALEATFKHGNLTLTWRAVLRDGSHYLRTELKLEASADTKMFAIIPMLYNVNVQQAGSSPKVVGNTRGAVLLSNKIFAGLETPTAYNTVGNGNDYSAFVHDAWTETSFSALPADKVPAEITSKGYTAQQIVAAQGYLSFKAAGQQTVTFQYTSGNHKLNIVGVDLLDLDGNIVAKDYHYGFTGGAKDKNVYTLNVPQKGVYTVRYLIETKTETVASKGRITYSGKVATPVVVFDLAPGSAPQITSPTQAAPAPRKSRALSASTLNDGDVLTDTWTTAEWQQAANFSKRIEEMGFYAPNVYSIERDLKIAAKGSLVAEFNYASGPKRLNIVGVDILDADGKIVSFDYHKGYTGTAKEANSYTFNVPYTGDFKLRYLVQNKSEEINSNGNISVKLVVNDTLHLAAAATMPIRGTWSRNTKLLAGQPWEVSAVVGLVAPDQPRRSFLAYSERERAVPWRAMPAYVSWYELNINRNNDRNYTTNMHDYQCEDVVSQWKTNLFDRYGEHINSFVWDDGWDEYGPWTFSPNFPSGWTETDRLARQMGSGIGAWLGPVGGYGTSGNYRRDYWKDKGGMRLSNPAYYKQFTQAITDLCKTKGYDFRFFKFDGISAQFTSVGPDAGDEGNENAEGIISAERMVRRDIKEDIFFNTSVGTWASPFWFSVTDAVWRQEQDYAQIGVGTDREQWITYRDRLVHQNFVQNSPICPINTLMTHGFILSKWGNVSKDMSYEGIVREMRCAFACGSGMVELYNDYELMNTLYGGRLWGDLAECLRWQRKNAEVLPDAHWVGGNPWDGSKANVYGWASWNGKRATLALRNPDTKAATYKTTLRQALEIPAYVSGTMIFDKSFGRQDALAGLAEGEAIDIDAPLTLSLPASSVFVFDGRNSDIPAVATTGVEITTQPLTLSVGEAKALVWNVLPAEATNQSVTWASSNEAVATVDNGIVKALKEGTAVITITASNGSTATLTIDVEPAKVEEYAVAFPKNEAPKNNSRFLRSIKVTSNGAEKTLTLNASHRPYQELLSDTITVSVGADITLTPDWQGSWMHGYVYLDADQSKQFDVEGAESPELVVFNYYNKQKKGAEGLTAEGNNNPGMANIPPFKAPTQPGIYRLRFKIDWDNINPAGQVEESNNILKNGGSITDFLIKVVDPNGLTAPTITEAPVYYDLSGRRVAQPAANTLYIRNGEKSIR